MSASLNELRISCLLVCHKAELIIRSEATANETVDLTDLNKAVIATKREDIDAFSSKIIQGQVKTILLGNNIHVMAQTLKGSE